MTESETRTRFVAATVTTAVLGLTVVIGTLAVVRSRAAGEAPHATAEYGRRLLRETSTLLGPDHPDPAMRYTGTRMSCASCHLETGTAPGTLTLLDAAAKYPRFSGRDGGERDLRDRINGCMQRSMNGRELPRDSAEMIAMEAYVLELGAQYALMGPSRRMADEPAVFDEPDRAADLVAGARVFESRCNVCHGVDGAGLRAAAFSTGGYLFPPLWGPDSFNNGAGMHRVLTAARFIKARMPLGEADLTDDEAFDVAAYINSHPRPMMSGLEVDYPDRALKPIDSPYPPYADPFPQAQHQFGPFAPIRAYYAAERAAGRTGGGQRDD